MGAEGMGVSAAIFGCSGPWLTEGEKAFFAEAQPWGFILFKRNVETPDQVRALVEALRACVGRADAPVLIDQEGGRVQRLGPPHWPLYPPGAAFAALARTDLAAACGAARLGARLIAHDLDLLGITVDCLPVLDVPEPGAHGVIGDRAYGDEPVQVAGIGRAAAEGLLEGGVLPVIKHIPGHGRAHADSHLALPVVDADLDVLGAVDFEAFREVADMPVAMTAHVVYAAVDPEGPATTSRTVLQSIVRGEIGFDGLLMTDDLSMKALSGTFVQRAEASLAAGCDVVLHCNGDMDEMQGVMAGTGALAGHAAERAAAALARIAGGPEPFDAEAGRVRFEVALAGVWTP